MIKRLDEHLETFKEEIAAAVVERVVGHLREYVETLRRGGPDVVTKKDACFRLGIKLTKLKGMIRRAEIDTCRIGDADMIPISEIQRLAQPAAPRIRRGGKPKSKKYSVRDEKAKLAELRAERKR